MKLSIIVKTKEDFKLILPLCEQIDKIQKEGKYLFYRFIYLCHQKNHTAFINSMKKYKINVPYSFVEIGESNSAKNRSLIQHIDDEMYNNPFDAILIIGWSEFNMEITFLASRYKIKILLLESMESEEMINGHYDNIFSTTDPDCWQNIINTLVKNYKL